MDLGLAGKTAIVCASSKGLGRGCAAALAQAGCNVVINGRNQAMLDTLAGELAQTFGVRVMPVAADVSTHDGRLALLNAAPEPDILINNNGGPPRRDFREVDEAALIEGVKQNFAAPLAMIQAVIDGMAERGFGRIVNITSLSVLMPLAGLDLSSGARAGLTAFLAGVVPQFAGRNVTINNLLPGKFDTDRLRAGLSWQAGQKGIDPQEEASQQAALIPAKRFGTAEEFGQVAAFLCSVHAGYMTGQNILLDGGLHRKSF